MDLSPETQSLIERTTELVAQYPDSEVYEIPDDGDYDHRYTKESLISAQVCTRKTATEAAEWLTTVRPPGTSHNRWEPSDVAEVACERFPDTHRHVIVEC